MALTYGSLGNTREVVLTFDDGPHPDTTPQILDALAEHDLRAIFFVLGERLESRRGQEIMRRAAEEGHTIANHTYSHPTLTKCSDERIRTELAKTQALIGDCASEPRLFRPPYGATNARVNRIVREEGYMNVMWNVDTLDWKKRSEAWVDHCMEQVEAREDALILMHDIHATTAAHVPALIERIQALDDVAFPPYA